MPKPRHKRQGPNPRRLIIYPLPKSRDVDDLLYQYTAMDRTQTTLARECMGCEGDAVNFSSDDAYNEYRNSCLCEDCQTALESGVIPSVRAVFVWSLTRTE